MKRKTKENLVLALVILTALVLFLVLYRSQATKIELPAGTEVKESSLKEWTVDSSSLNNVTLREDKSIYGETDTNLYDVYISVFPTKDENGEMLDFSAFSLHQSRDHTYNPILDCNIQILQEGMKPDPLINLDLANAVIRVRGNSSRGDTYKSYKVKLNEDTEGFFGQYNLNINKHSEDVCKVSTKLCTDLLTGIDELCSFQTRFMRVWIRDTSLPEEKQEFKYYGLYTQIEQPNKSYLETRGLSSNASLYKARNFSFQMSDALKNVDDPDYDETAFEEILGIREAKDHTELLEMIEAVNDTTRDFEEIFYTYFDEENYITWLAFNLLLGNNDIINHNFLLYHPDNNSKWYFIPWDFDGTLQYGEYESSLMKLPLNLKGAQKLNQSVLHRRFLRLPGSIEKITKKMEELLAEDITEEKVKSLTDSYMPVLEKTVSLPPDIELLEMAPNELPDYIDGLYDCIYNNYETFKAAMEYSSPMYVQIPEKNADGTIHYAWDSSFSYQGRTITYNVAVATDYYMKDIVYEEKGLTSTSLDSKEALEPGTYYLKVTAVDSEGNEQLSMERFETMLTAVKGLNVNGVLEFKIE